MEGIYSKLNEVANVMGAQYQQLGTISSTMAAQGIGNLVPNFSGKPQEFRDWIMSLDKYRTLTRADPDEIKRVAFQTARGVVSDFIGRQLKSSPNESWAELKRQLTTRFGEITDEHHAFALLQKFRQRREESVPLFAETLLSLAHEAFPEGLG